LSNDLIEVGVRLSIMCICGMSRAYPEFYLTEEDVKKFAFKMKISIKRLFGHGSKPKLQEQSNEICMTFTE
jgi:hypothetical protein